VSDENSPPRPDDGRAGAGEYCREVEAYLCRKNDGHLIRIAGPSFSRVSGWAQQGIPLNVVYRGIDQYFERYYARGQRRRPVHIDFCEGDVLALFDEWRRAVGPEGPGGDLQAEEPADADRNPAEADRPNPAEADRPNPAEAGSHVRNARTPRRRRGPSATSDRDAARQPATAASSLSLAAHLERVIVRLTALRGGGRLTAAADAAIDTAIRQLDAERRTVAHLEGETRASFLTRLGEVDAHLVQAVSDGLGARERRAIEREAEAELEPYRAGMAAEAYARARTSNYVRLLRQRTGLPVVSYEDTD
jgi:hypothetical protein